VLRATSVCLHADANTPVEPMGCICRFFPHGYGLPRYQGGSASTTCVFEACSTFATRFGLHARSGRPRRPFRGDFDDFVTSIAAPCASGWSDPSPGGICTH